MRLFPSKSLLVILFTLGCVDATTPKDTMLSPDTDTETDTDPDTDTDTDTDTGIDSGDSSSDTVHTGPAPLSFDGRHTSASYYHSCGGDGLGQVQCWGDDAYGQSSVPAGDYVLVNTGYVYSCAVTTTGSITCWGLDASGISQTPSGSFVTVDPGGAHVCGLQTNGAIACWGSGQTNTGVWPELGQAIAPSGTYTQVVTGYAYSCGLTATGSIECWGDDTYGQSQPPPVLLPKYRHTTTIPVPSTPT